MARLVQLVPSIGIETPIARPVTSQALHQGGSRRINDVLQALQWIGFSDPDDLPNYIVLIDDLITTGSSFKACQRLIHEHYPTLKVYGVFWARTIWQDEEC
jgi:predicted amidophosphoribosyltransferase